MPLPVAGCLFPQFRPHVEGDQTLLSHDFETTTSSSPANLSIYTIMAFGGSRGNHQGLKRDGGGTCGWNGRPGRQSSALNKVCDLEAPKQNGAQSNCTYIGTGIQPDIGNQFGFASSDIRSFEARKKETADSKQLPVIVCLLARSNRVGLHSHTITRD